MGLIDTHNHLYLEEFDEDREALIREARESGIERLLLPNVDEETVDRLFLLADTHPEFVSPMMGLHPTSVDGDYVRHLSKIESFLSQRPYCAIGEIGIDLYWDKTWIKEQKIVFEEQLRWSLAMNLPVAIHTRDAFPEVFDSIHRVDPTNLKGVFHSFGGTAEELEEIHKLPGFKLGINGVITFKNSGLKDVLKHTTIDQIILETDAPYLAPVPYRGKRNLPIYIWKTAEMVAEIFDLTLVETVKIARQNTLNLFKDIKNAE